MGCKLSSSDCRDMSLNVYRKNVMKKDLTVMNRVTFRLHQSDIYRTQPLLISLFQSFPLQTFKIYKTYFTKMQDKVFFKGFFIYEYLRQTMNT